MISISKSIVPAYLQKGEFYLSLGCDGDEEVEVPADTLKPDSVVINVSDLRHLLLSLRFWIVSELPRDVVAFVMTMEDNEIGGIMLEFSVHIAQLQSLWIIKQADECERMELAIRSGILEIVEYLFMPADSGDFCPIAAKHGQLACLMYFHEQGATWDHRTTKAAALFGHLDCLRYAMENGCHAEGNAEGNAEALAGPVFPYAEERICTVALTVAPYMQTFYVHPEENTLWFEGLCDVPMQRKLACLQYLRDQGCMWGWSTYRMAAACGDVQTLLYVHEQGCPVFEDACSMAARYGHLECLKYLHIHGGEWDEQATSLAAEYGRLSCLQYLCEHGCDRVDHICCIAAQYGQSDCLRYTHEHGGTLSWRTFYVAASSGSVECVKYLHEQGCERRSDACSAAAERGHLHCLQYLHTHGCPWDAQVLEKTALRGQLDCLQYLVKNGCPLGRSGTGAADTVRKLKQQNELYRKMGVPTADHFDAVIEYLEQIDSL